MLEEEREHADLVHSTEVGWRPRRTNVIHVQESVGINRPLEEVFSYTTNPEYFHHCAATVMEIRHEDAPEGEGPLGRKGERFTLVQQALGRRFEALFEVIDYEPNRRYVHRGAVGQNLWEVGKFRTR